MGPLKSKVSITLDWDIIEKVKILAEEDNRSFSQYVNMLLKTQLACDKAEGKSNKKGS